MRLLILTVLLAALSIATAIEYLKYDAATVRRFDNELRRLGVVLPTNLMTVPDKHIDPPDPKVTSSAGDFEGFWAKSQLGRPFAAFEGIPYAQPPVGALRFKVAQPFTRRLYNFKAKTPGSKCTQKPLGGIKIEGSEDCLFINVYTPEKVERSKAEQLPVMFWIHGGGFQSDAGHNFQGHILMDKDVVLVTFNYRLGALGFMTTEDDVIPGNLGIKDMVLALKWVHQNIAAFGGDPNLITVFGESSGGFCAEVMTISPLTKGLIHRLIAMSGASMSFLRAISPPGEMQRNVQTAAQHLNCPATPSQRLLDCLRTKSAEDIINVASKFVVWGQRIVIPFAAVIEGEIPGAVLPHHPSKLWSDGPANDVPYMSGILSEEGLSYGAGIARTDSQLRELSTNYRDRLPEVLSLVRSNGKPPSVVEAMWRAYITPGPLTKSNVIELANLFSDAFFMLPAVMSKQQHRRGSRAPSYFYYLNHEGSRSFVPTFPGAAHGDDLFYLFNLTSYRFPAPTPSDVAMSLVWTDLFTSFARDGVPSSAMLKTPWQPLTTAGIDMEYLHVKSPSDITMAKGLLPERWQLMQILLGHEQYVEIDPIERLFLTDRSLKSLFLDHVKSSV